MLEKAWTFWDSYGLNFTTKELLAEEWTTEEIIGVLVLGRTLNQSFATLEPIFKKLLLMCPEIPDPGMFPPSNLETRAVWLNNDVTFATLDSKEGILFNEGCFLESVQGLKELWRISG